MPHWLREAAAAGHAWLGLQRLLVMLLLNLCFRPMTKHAEPFSGIKAAETTARGVQ